MAAVAGAHGLISDAQSGEPPFEARPAGEVEAIRAVVSAIEGRVRTAAKDGSAHRDAHPKAHGCVKAVLQVLDNLPEDLAAGLFAKPATYQAWVRFSNAAEQPQADSEGDGRGMAIKVMGVPGGAAGTQDFLLVSAPAFLVRDAADYVAFQTAANPLWGFFLTFRKLRLHELRMALAITGRKVSNPLNIQYWSMAPLLCGNIACKVSARPVGPPSPFVDRVGPNFLRRNLMRGLAAGDATFELCIQRRTKPDRMPIEDPTIVWSEADAPFTPVARLTLPRQAIDGPGRDALGETLSFTPWHGLEAHRPLGGMNRVRRAVYEAISRLRHDLNGEVRAEPTGFQTTDPSGL